MDHRTYLTNLAALLHDNGYRNLRFRVEPFQAQGEEPDNRDAGVFHARELGISRFIDLTLHHDKAQGSEPYLAWELDTPNTSVLDTSKGEAPGLQLALMTADEPAQTVTQVASSDPESQAHVEQLLARLARHPAAK